MTIFAQSSGAGRAGVAVIRLSGPASGSALQVLAGLTKAPPARHATRVRLRAAGETIDQSLCLWFPAPHSFTGEDVVELHVHGGAAVVARVLEELSGLAGLRLAEAGEFTRRAFDNGKLDLTQVEGLADLVEAETEAQRRQAQRALDGELGALYGGWSRRVMRILAHLEAAMDFPDDLDASPLDSAFFTEIDEIVGEIERHLVDYEAAELVREGVRVTIVGAPNVGKSSLLNRLARRDAAIVAAEPGTTRDVVEVALNVAGFRIWLADTAGLREASGEVEREGVRRARSQAAGADLRLAVFDARALRAAEGVAAPFVDDRTLVVFNKVDLVPGLPHGQECGEAAEHRVSALTGQGIDELRNALAGRVAELTAVGGAPVIRERYRSALNQCLQALHRSGRAADQELAAEDARLALRALGRITGRVDVEDLLDVVFRDFCLGK